MTPLSPKTREVLDWLDARRRETEQMCDNTGDVRTSGIARDGRESHIISADPASSAIPEWRRVDCVHRGIDR